MKSIRLIVAALLVAVGTAVPAFAEPQTFTVEGGPTSATKSTPVPLDTDVYLPEASGPAPAVILAHGFGGSKRATADLAQKLADAGFIAISYTARGFGKSGGLISMNSPEFEVKDVSELIDFAAQLKDIQLDGTNDPRIAIAGGSYGGAISLLAAGYDDRIDAVVSDITYNNLQQALFPQFATNSTTPGVFKKLWTSYFFSAGFAGAPGQATLCGRFAPEWCALYEQASTTGTLDDNARALLRASSPISVTDRITVPTMLMAGQADSLFPLSEVDATAKQIAAANPSTPLKVVWHSAGHDGGIPERERLEQLTIDWFNKHLRNQGSISNDFEATLITGQVLGRRSGQPTIVEGLATYPGVQGQRSESIALQAPPQQVLAPAGGAPAAISSLPGLASVASLASRMMPGQTAIFQSKPLEKTVTIVGSSKIQLAVASETPQKDAVFFASLRIVTPAGIEVLPNGLVSPIRIAEVGPQPTIVTVKLPAIFTSAEPGDILRVVVSTTDFGYQLPQQAAIYTVALVQPSLAVATSDLVPLAGSTPAWRWPAGAVGLTVLLLLVLWLRKPRHKDADTRQDLLDVPIAVENLAKEFKGGLRAVNGITYQVPKGKVIGLLGPNGAGKTTTMRMALGLILPTEGNVYVFGERVTPGNPVLSRVGSFVEGPGFLPHLSGKENLELYWQASGRRGIDPKFDEILEIANLGTAINRKVKGYSQGMRQRLGIAQAMLGMPDLLILDEPTNGLDPQQIREMREVVHNYAATGRTVVVSSHLLSEVEQTCSYVVVMHRGQLVTQGEVSELLSGRTHMRLEDFFMEVIGDDLAIGKA